MARDEIMSADRGVTATAMTYADALTQGYTLTDQTYFRGYVSRRVDPSKQPIKIAGGTRSGELFVELPYWHSTTYSIRQYLRAPRSAQTETQRWGRNA